MDTEKQKVMRNHMYRIYHTWLTRDTYIQLIPSYCELTCYCVQSHGWVPSFQRSILPPSSL